MGVNFEPAFASNIKAAYGDSGLKWLQNLSSHINGLCREWDCRFIQPMPNLSFNFVGIVEMNATGNRAVLKTCPPGGPVIDEVRWLRQFQDIVPQVIHADSNAFLMEQCLPGISLAQNLPDIGDEKATRILCNTIRALQRDVPNDRSFKHLSDLVSDLSLLEGIGESYLVAKAQSLFIELTQDRSRDVLLHGDLHHYNVISHGDAWKAIDPHGLIGDPASEVGVLIFNPIYSFGGGALKDVLERRLAILKEELSFDPKRIQAWAFCRTVLSAAWCVQDSPDRVSSQLSIASAIGADFKA